MIGETVKLCVSPLFLILVLFACFSRRGESNWSESRRPRAYVSMEKGRRMLIIEIKQQTRRARYLMYTPPGIDSRVRNLLNVAVRATAIVSAEKPSRGRLDGGSLKTSSNGTGRTDFLATRYFLITQLAWLRRTDARH